VIAIMSAKASVSGESPPPGSVIAFPSSEVADVAGTEQGKAGAEPEGAISVVGVEATPDSPAADWRSSVAASLDAVAAAWSSQREASPGAPPAGVPTPEALLTMAAERGLEIHVEYRSVGTLVDADLPCVALMADGSAITLVHRAAGTFGVRRGEETLRRDAAEITKAEARVLFFPRPKLDLPRGTDAVVEEEPGPLAISPNMPGVLRLMLGQMWRDHRGRVLQLLAANMIGNLFLVALPIYSMAVYDRVIPHLAMETLWALTAGVLVALVADFGVRAVKSRVIDAVAYSVATSVQARFYNRLLHVELSSAPRSSAAANQGLRDIEALCLALPNLIAALFIDLPFLLVLLVVISAMSGWVAAVPAAGIVAMVVIYAVSHIVSQNEAVRRSALARAQSNLLQESIDGLETVKVTGAEPLLLGRWERMADATAYSGHRSRSWNGYATLASMSLGQIVIVLAMFVSVFEISNGVLTIGALSATSMLVGRMLAPVSQVVSVLHQMKVLLKTLDGIDVVLKAPVERAGDSSHSPVIRGLIELRGVNFSYAQGDEGCLKDLTLTIRPGEKVAVIGRIGCGKSTLLKLLVRLLVPRSGSVLLDGTDVRQFSPGLVRRTIGYMGQNHMLFDDTLHANLCLGLRGVGTAVFDRAVAVSGIADVASRQAEGYSMRVGPRGERLSGGERQLVGLARALMGEPSILILDEPTASMDNGLEARIIRDLQADLGSRTLIVATHRAALLELVDRIIWLDDGRIVADGPKADVLSRLRRQAA
jgi:ATP-binding cassette, subfamily C, bacterial LapB